MVVATSSVGVEISSSFRAISENLNCILMIMPGIKLPNDLVLEFSKALSPILSFSNSSKYVDAKKGLAVSESFDRIRVYCLALIKFIFANYPNMRARIVLKMLEDFAENNLSLCGMSTPFNAKGSDILTPILLELIQEPSYGVHIGRPNRSEETMNTEAFISLSNKVGHAIVCENSLFNQT
jgi:hypothetical protein